MIAGLALPVMPTKVGIHVVSCCDKAKIWMSTFVGMTRCQEHEPPFLLHAMISMFHDSIVTSTVSRQSTMLTIRNVEVTLRDHLRVRATRHCHSIEAEVLAILRDTLGREHADEPNLGEAIRRRFAPFGGVELDNHPPVAHPS